MTDEEVIREALKTVTEYSNRNPGDTFNVNVCVERTLASVHRVWREARKYSFHQALKWEDDLPFQGFLLSEKIPSCRREQQHNENRKICAAF